MNRRVLASLLATSLSAVGLMAQPAFAAPTCVVDSFVDAAGSDANGSRTLRFCLGAVDPAGTITFSTGGTDQIIELGSGLTRSGAVTIDGDGEITIKPQTGQTIRLLTSDAITIEGMTFQGGDAGASDGGAVLADGLLIVRNSTFSNNSARHGGAIATLQAFNVEAYDSTFTNNTATGDGGAIDTDDVDIFRSVFTGNTAGGEGGAIWSDDDYYGEDSTYTSNVSGGDGGAIYASDMAETFGETFTTNEAGDDGGAIWSDGDSEVGEGTVFRGNEADGDGGAINTNGELVDSGGSLYVENVALNGPGGALWIGSYWYSDDASFVNNEAADSSGGAVAVENGNGTVKRNYFGGNSAYDHGGAISAESNLKITNSTFYANTAGSDGGAIKNTTDSDQNGYILYSTFVGNSAATAELVSWINDDLVLFGNLFLDHDANSLVDNGNGANGIIDAGFNVSTATEAELDDATSRTSISYASLGVGRPGTASTTSRPLVPISNFSNLSVQVTEDAVTAAQTATGLTFPTVDQSGVTRVFTFYPGAQLLKDAPPYVGPVVSKIGASPATMVITEKQQVNLTGLRLGSISKALIDGKECEIVSAAEDELVIITPEGLGVGQFALVVFSDFGRLTIQDAFVVQESVTSATDGFKAWTKKQVDGSVKVYAKNVTGAGKVQFFVDGQEVAWVNDVDGTDPKLRFAGGSAYLVRTVSLDPGKNRFEINLDGVRVWRATYSG